MEGSDRACNGTARMFFIFGAYGLALALLGQLVAARGFPVAVTWTLGAAIGFALLLRTWEF